MTTGGDAKSPKPKLKKPKMPNKPNSSEQPAQIDDGYRRVFALDLAKAKDKLNWGQKLLCDKAAVSKSTLTKVENGKYVSSKTLQKIQQAVDLEHRRLFDCPFDWAQNSTTDDTTHIGAPKISEHMLNNFIAQSDVVKRIQDAAHMATNLRISLADDYIKVWVTRLHRLQIRNLSAIAEELVEREQLITRFVINFYQANVRDVLPDGLGIAFLMHAKILDSGGQQELEKFMIDLRWNPARKPEELAEKLASAYAQAKKQLGL
jgi:transcriptional regulator with XRE-family HTH domain